MAADQRRRSVIIEQKVGRFLFHLFKLRSMLLKISLPVALVAGFVAYLSFGALARAEENSGSKNPVEIGTVDWGRDIDAAFSQSRQSGKPVFVLFQEVPGCAGCQKFGHEVLSQPLVVEAIEDEFIPVVVYNNRSSGTDKQLLDRFKERAWNYQVVRFLDADGNDLIERREGVWSVDGIAGRMIEVLEKTGRPVPNYLRTLVAVNDTSSHQTVAFAMHCFWTGEYRLGGIDGVVATEAGFLDGREVTLVKFDNETIDLASLAGKAAEVKCANKVYTPGGENLAGLTGGTLDNSYRAASRSDQKRQISRWTELENVSNINAMQLTKINSLAPRSMRLAVQWLSPRQRQQLQ